MVRVKIVKSRPKKHPFLPRRTEGGLSAPRGLKNATTYSNRSFTRTLRLGYRGKWPIRQTRVHIEDGDDALSQVLRTLVSACSRVAKVQLLVVELDGYYTTFWSSKSSRTMSNASNLNRIWNAQKRRITSPIEGAVVNPTRI